MKRTKSKVQFGDPEAHQLVLPDWFPPEMPVPEIVELPVADILEHLWASMFGPQPDKPLLDSISQYGILQPVLLLRVLSDGQYGYFVLDGRRRLRAAVKLGIASVKAQVYQQDSREAAPALTLTVNQNRRRNIWVEYQAVKDLLDRDATEQQITMVTGLPIPTIRLRMKLGRLHPFFQDCLKNGAITANVAMATAKLPETLQIRLVAQWGTKSRLTLSDLKAVRLATHKAATATLGEALGDIPIPDDMGIVVGDPMSDEEVRYHRVFTALCRAIGAKAAAEIAEGTEVQGGVDNPDAD